MAHSKVANLISTLPGHTERTVKYVAPLTVTDGGIGYDRPLANYLDASKATYRLPLERTSSRLYDTIASAHDHRRPSRDPSFSFALSRDRREQGRSVAKLARNSPDYLGISPDFPGWRPRRSSHEDRRGAIPVAPSDVSTLLPSMDTSSPPPSQEWLDERAKQILAAAHAEVETQGDLYSNELPSSGTMTASSIYSNNQNYLDLHFDYGSDITFGSLTTTARRAQQQSFPQPFATNSDSKEPAFNLNTETETDTDIDEESDDGYNWSIARICEASPHALADIPRWIIPRKQSSVVIPDNGDVPADDDDDEDDDDDDDDLPIIGSSRSSRSSTPTEGGTPPLSSDDEYMGKRRRGGSVTPRRAVKKLKRHSADTPARQGRRCVDSADSYSATDCGEDTSSSERAFSLPPRASISSIRSSSPPASPPPVASSSIQPIPSPPQTESRRLTPHRSTATRIPPHPKSAPKSYPCHLDGCTQVCASVGDLQRHQQSLRHRAASFICLACGKIYTRPDALKRHLNTKAACKKEHVPKLARGAEEERAEAEEV